MALAFVALTLAARAGAAHDVSLIDVIELDMGFTTINDNYFKSVPPQRLLDGARTGLLTFLQQRGFSKAEVGAMHARSDGRGVVPAIEQQLGKTIARYGARVEPRELVYAAIRGELAALHDPYSVFFTKSELGRFTTALDGTRFGGIGVVLGGDRSLQYRADQVFADSPAARAGILPADRLIAVNGTLATGLTPEAVSALLRGRIGSRLQIEIARDGDATDRNFTLVRAAIEPPQVSARRLPADVGYLALRTFGPTAGSAVHTALARLHAEGVRSIVFDLRGNGGGYESAAVQVASAFIGRGTVVITQTHHGHKQVTLANGSALRALPLVVLVDHDSASGSELVTGAIVDHQLGKVVGTRTFGKGLVQTIFPLPDGSAMKVTTARYFTPSGRDINQVGITPNLIVAEPDSAARGVPGRDPQLDAALVLLTASPAAPPIQSPQANNR